MASVRKAVLDHLADGFEEGILYGMLSYNIPLSRYPATDNKPLTVVSAIAGDPHGAVHERDLRRRQARQLVGRSYLRSAGPADPVP